MVDEGRQNARVGIDAFAGNLFGTIDSIEVADLNRWVRQGQPLCTITREGRVALDEFLSEWEIFRASVDRVLGAG